MRVPATLAAICIVAVGVSQSFQDLRSDDWVYLQWAREHPGPWAFLLEPPPYPYLRPLNALAWQWQARFFGTSGWPIEILLLGLWVSALALLYRVAATRVAPLAGIVAVALALTTPELRTLPNWRSWLTTVGELAGILAAIAAARHPRAWPPFAMLAFGAAFKEGAWWQGGLAMAALGRFDVAVPSLVAYVVHAGVTAAIHVPGEIGFGFVPGNLRALGSTLVAWGWPVALGVASLVAPREAWRQDGARLALAGVGGTMPALSFHFFSPVYVVEPALLLMLGLLGPAAAGVRRFPMLGWPLALALALWMTRPAAWADYTDNVLFQARRGSEARAIVAEAGRVDAVWAPADDQGRCGLAADLLVYDQHAARLAERPEGGRELGGCVVVTGGDDPG